MNRTALRRYLRYYRSARSRIALGVLLSLVRAALLIPVPILVGRAIDLAIPEGDVAELVRYGAAIVGLTLAAAGVSIASRYVTVVAIRGAIARLREDAVSKLFMVSRRYYTSTDSSVLHDQVVHESGRVSAGTSAVLEQYVPGVVLIIGLGTVLLRMNTGLALITLAFGPAIILTGRILGRSVRVRVRRQHQSFERYSHGVLRVLRAMDLIRSHGAEEREQAFLAQRGEELETVGVARAVWTNIYSVAQGTLLSLVGTTVLIMGGVQVINGAMTFGELIAFYAGFALIRGPLGSIALRAPAVIEGMQSLGHLEGLLAEPDARPYLGSRRVDTVRSIQVSNVTFAYDDEPVLHDVTLELEPGRTLGLIGPNGSGKSTIVNLLLGFYRPDVGTVLADGVPYDELDLTQLRRAIGVVPQQPILLQGSVAENIAYGREGIGADEVEAALQLAGADFVAGLPEGVDTDIGAEGVFLSGGQRQRLALARASVHMPRLLILDEPTNHLDQDSVADVMNSIVSLESRPTVLLISHQSEALTVVDKLVELKEGRVIGSFGLS